MWRAILVVAAASAASAQTTWYVDVAGTPPGSGTQDDPYTSIQYAIEQPATLSGDTLLVAAGTYPEALDYRGKRLSIVGDAAERPVIDAGGLAPVVSVVSGEPAGTELVGFELTGGVGGDATGTCYDCATGGAGVYCVGSSVDLVDCRLTGLGADSGGALFAADATVRLLGCELARNGAMAQGAHAYLLRTEARLEGCLVTGRPGPFGYDAPDGGIYAVDSTLRVEGCTFARNSVEYSGSALYLDGGVAELRGTEFEENYCFDYAGTVTALDTELLVERCTFTRNESCVGWGGAIYLGCGTARVVGCDFVDNTSAEGGALCVRCGHAEVRASTFVGNVAGTSLYWETGSGGAVFVDEGATATLRGCLFRANLSTGHPLIDLPARGGAVAGPALLERCSLVDNQAVGKLWGEGGGVYGPATVADSIVVHCFPDGCAGGAQVRYSLVGWGVPGEGNIGGEPLFVDPDAGDFALAVGSPCVDAGDPASALDADGTRADMGAFPYAWSPVGTPYCDAVPNSTGLPAAILARGSEVVAEDWLRLDVTQLPPGRLATFLFSAGADFVPGFGGGMGNLCLAEPLHRLARPGDVLTTGDGALDVRPVLGDLPQGVVMLPGETWHWQLWFRDELGGTPTSNTSDAAAILWQ